MRTTISIQDALLRRAREESLARNCSLGDVVEDALRVALSARPKSAGATGIRPLKTFRGSGLQPGVDLSSSAGLLEIMEGR
ncbi:MAG: CopG family transcriptional regulator [Terrimicrobiaceae bacterium]|jgi:hypothetical protein